MSNSRSQINSNFYQIANTDPVCGNVTGVNIGNVWATGNVTAAYFFGNGSQLSGLPATYSNANVANYLQTLTSNVTTTANITGDYILGNGAFLTGLPATYGNANVANYLQTLTSNVTTTANVQAGYFIGNGSQLTGLPEAYSNANVAAYLSSDPNLNITINGTVTADVFYGDVIGNIQGNFTVAGANTGVLFKDNGNANAVTGFVFDKTTNTVSIGSNLTVGNVNSQYLYGNIRGTTGGYDDTNVAAYLPGYLTTYTGNLQSGNLLVVNSAVIQGNLTVLGNTTTINANTLNINDKDITVANGAVTAAEANGAGLIVGQGNLANIIFNNPANAWTLYPGVSTPGNVTGAYLIGDGYYLTNIQASNIIGGYGNAQVANYLQVLTSNITTTANVQAAYFLGNGSQLTGLPATYSNANVAAYLPVYGGNILGDVISGNIRVVSMLPAYANGQLANSDVDIGNVSHYFGNVYARALILPPSNFNNGFEIGVASGPGQSGAVFIDPLTGNATDIFAADGYFNNLDLQGSVTADSYVEGSELIALGNITAGGNANVIGNLIANNAIANFYYGNGYYLSGIQASNIVGAYGNANVANYLPTYTGNLASSSDIIALYANAAVQSNAIANLQAAQYSNANVSNFLANGFGSNTITTTGNIQAGTVKGTNFQATSSAGGTLKNSSGITQASWGAGGGDNFSVLVSTNLDGANAQIDISPTGTGHVHIKPTGTGAVEIAPTNTGSVNNMVIGNVTPAAANVTTLGATGNITANYYFGNGAFLSGLNANYGNANVANYLPTYSGNLGYITVEALVSKQDILANASIEVINEVRANSFNGNGRHLFDILYANITGAYSNANVAAYLPTYSGNLAQSSDIIALYANAATQSNAIANLQSAQYSNANVANYLGVLTSNVTTTANISGNYILGNGAFLTGITAGSTYSNANVANYLQVLSSNVTTTANIQANYFIGNGSQLTDITIPLSPAVLDFTFSGETSNGAVTDEIVSYAFSSDYSQGNGNVSGTTWTRYTTGTGEKAAVSDTGVFITDGEYSINGGTTWSTLGVSWGGGTTYGLAFGNVSGTPTWVRVASAGIIYYNNNANGIPTGTWTAATESATGLLYAAAYGNGVFIAAGDDASAWYSTNGITWSASGTDPSQVRGLLWDGTRWLAIGNGGLFYSTDNGGNWTRVGTLTFGSFPGGISYNNVTNGIYRISGGSASTIYWCNGDPTVSGNWVTQTSVANLSVQNGQMQFIGNTWFASGAGIYRTSDANANVWTADTTTGRVGTLTGYAKGPNAVIFTSTSEVERIPFNAQGVYNIGLPADPTYGANTITFTPSSGANANVAAVELGNLIVANRPAYTASYANSRVTVIDTNSGGDITGAFTVAAVSLPAAGTITLSVSDGANSVQDVITFTDPVTSATFQYSPAFNSNISNIVTDIGTTETLPDWLGSVFDSDTVRFTSNIPGFIPFNSLLDASITNGLSNGVVTTLAVSRTIDSYGYSGATVPGGNDTELQFNDNGSFGGTNGIYYNATTSLLSLPAVIERVFTTNTPMTGNIDYDVQNQGILYYNVNATANANINFRGYSALTLDNTLQVDDSITVKLWNQNGATAYLPVNYTIDGSNITPVWLNGTAPTAANANSTMQYTYTIVKTAANTYTVLASQQRFA